MISSKRSSKIFRRSKPTSNYTESNHKIALPFFSIRHAAFEQTQTNPIYQTNVRYCKFPMQETLQFAVIFRPTYPQFACGFHKDRLWITHPLAKTPNLPTFPPHRLVYAILCARSHFSPFSTDSTALRRLLKYLLFIYIPVTISVSSQTFPMCITFLSTKKPYLIALHSSKKDVLYEIFM